MTEPGEDGRTNRPTGYGERGPHSRVNEGAAEPGTWVGRATARPAADPWPTTEQPIYEFRPAPGQPMYQVIPPAVPGQQPIVVYAQPPRRRRGTTFLVLAGIIAACCAGGATIALISSVAVRDAVGISPGNPAAPAPTTPVPTTPAEPGLNTPVRDGKFEFVVTSVSCGHKSVGNGLINAKAKGQYCLVSLSVSNVSDSGQLMVDGLQRGFDADGTSYPPDSGAGVIASFGTSTWLNMIEPGKIVTGTIVYDLPKGDELARLELHDSLFSRGVTVTVPAE